MNETLDRGSTAKRTSKLFRGVRAYACGVAYLLTFGEL